MEIYSLYNRPKVSGLKCPEKSLTEQVYKDQCDLNFLIRKYGLEDDPFQLMMYIDPTTRAKQYIDTTQVPDLYGALLAQKRLRAFFNELDYAQQEMFNFSVDAFGDYLMAASEDEIKKLGLKNIVFRPDPEPVPEAAAQPKDQPNDQPKETKAS